MGKPTTERRFWAKVDDTNGPFGCWFWTASRDKDGYGWYVGGQSGKKAHRYAYELAFGPVPEGAVLDHLCDAGSSGCVRPDHMRPVTNVANVMRGRSPAAANARKTHCDAGHEFTLENTYRPPGRPGARHCRTCRSDRRAA